jgi:hypothetical protein
VSAVPPLKRSRRLCLALLALAALSCGGSATAQSVEPAQVSASEHAPVTDNVGQRQLPTQIAPHIRPMERLSSRVPNRIQSRINNRIGRGIGAVSGVIWPFAAASARARATSEPR